MTDQDLYNVKLKRREAYTYFLANKETDTTLLPLPLTEEETEMYDDCITAATALVAAAEAAAAAAAAEAGSGGGSGSGGGT